MRNSPVLPHECGVPPGYGTPHLCGREEFCRAPSQGLLSKDLRVWQEAMDLAMEIFTVSKSFPADERFSLTDQVRRSSRSVPANISEAWRKRRYEAAFVSKLNDGEGEAAETQTHLEIARRCGYVTNAQAQALDQRYEHLLGQLVTMANRPEVWTSTSPIPRVSKSQSLS